MDVKNVLVLVTKRHCGACESLKARGGPQKYLELCNKRGDVEFHHQELRDDSDGKDRYPAFTLDPIAWYPTIMLFRVRGVRKWDASVNSNQIVQAFVLNGKWKSAHEPIEQNLNDGYKRDPEEVARWLNDKLGPPRLGAPTTIASAYNIRGAGSVSPSAQHPSYGAGGVRYMPSPPTRTTSLYTGNPMRHAYGHY